MRRAGAGALLGALTLAAPREALAVEHEWHLGAAATYSRMVFDRSPTRNGFGGEAIVRYGLTDALDLSMSAWVASFLEDQRLALGTSAGIAYVVDVSRWIPTIAAHVGVVDVATTRCPEAFPELCTHDVRPMLAVPASLEFRAVDELPLGVRFEYRILLLGEPSSMLSFGIYGAYTL
jgi:hypothetical protein